MRFGYMEATKDFNKRNFGREVGAKPHWSVYKRHWRGREVETEYSLEKVKILFAKKPQKTKKTPIKQNPNSIISISQGSFHVT